MLVVIERICYLERLFNIEYVDDIVLLYDDTQAMQLSINYSLAENS